jgi:hypothetical protein
MRRFCIFPDWMKFLQFRANTKYVTRKMKMYTHFRYSRVHQEITFLSCRKEVIACGVRLIALDRAIGGYTNWKQDFGIISCFFFHRHTRNTHLTCTYTLRMLGNDSVFHRLGRNITWVVMI